MGATSADMDLQKLVLAPSQRAAAKLTDAEDAAVADSAGDTGSKAALPDADCTAALSGLAGESIKPEAIWARGGDGPYEQLLKAALALTALPRGAPHGGIELPPWLTGVFLSGSVAMLDALHRRRFGDLSQGEAPKREAAPEAVEAARACCLLDHVRLCSNVLYEQPHAQDYLRHIGGLKSLLSHCYADPEHPMLREVAVFAVRNATHGCAANQAAARELLAERKQATDQGAGGPLPPSVGEFDFGA